MGDSQVEVTLAEYGNAVNTTAKLRGTSFLDVDAAAANLVGYNAGISIDGVIRDVLAAGTNVVYGGGGTTTPTARTGIAAADIIEANDVRRVVAALRKANAVSFNGMYMGYIHPDVSYDLRRETGVASWRDPHVYSDPANIYNGEIGAFETALARLARWMRTAPTSAVVRLWRRRTASSTATARSRVSFAVRWWTSSSASSRSAGTGSVATHDSARLRCVALSRRRQSAQTELVSSVN
ncbi:MAG: N4-gp56 family major capsid protein [Chitinophagales bacterium]|nr:N4-gp56 family major capsid protein [Chitinophagales bacterium]